MDRITKQDKLGALRSQSAGPLSIVITRLFVLVAISGVIFVMGERALDGLLRPFDSWTSLVQSPLELVRTTIVLPAILSAAVLVVGVVSSVAQIGSGSFASRLRHSNRTENRRSPLTVVVLAMVSSLVGALAIRYSLGDLLAILSVKRNDLGPDLIKGLLNNFSKLVVVASAVLAILVVFGCRFGSLIKPTRRG